MVTDVAFKWRRSDNGSNKLFLFYAFQQLVFPGNIQHRCLFNTSQHRIPLTAESLNHFHLLRSGFFGSSQGDVRRATYGLLGSVGHLKTLRKVDILRGRRHLAFDYADTTLLRNIAMSMEHGILYHSFQHTIFLAFSHWPSQWTDKKSIKHATYHFRKLYSPIYWGVIFL